MENGRREPMTELDRLMEGEGVTPLMRAIHAKRPEEVEALIDGAADPNARSKQGLTPLFLAVLEENVALTETLLALGANARGARRRATACDRRPAGLGSLRRGAPATWGRAGSESWRWHHSPYDGRPSGEP